MEYKTIVLVDFHTGGHHAMYMRMYARALLELNNDVWILYPDPHIFNELKAEYGKKISVYACREVDLNKRPFISKLFRTCISKINTSLVSLHTALFLWTYTAYKLKIITFREGKKPDVVIFGFFDNFMSRHIPIWIIDLCFHQTWIGLWFEPLDKMGVMRKVEDICIFKSKHCSAIFILNENAMKNIAALSYRVYTMPDFTYEQYTITNRFRHVTETRIKKRKVITSIGGISHRKGIIPFIRTIKTLDTDDFFFIMIIGSLDISSFAKDDRAFLQEFMDTPPENCLIIPDKIENDSEFNGIIYISDILYAAYIDFTNSSNLLTKASIFKKPVIVSSNSLMAQRVQEYGLGVCVVQNTVSDIHSAVTQVSIGNDLHGNKLRPRFADYSSQHSIKKLKEILSSIHI